MRVLITPEWYPDAVRPQFGVFCREQARAAARRHDVVVLTWTYDSQLRRPFCVDEFTEEGLRTFRVRFRGSRVAKLPGAFKLAGVAVVLLRLRRAGWTPDVIHAHEYAAGRLALVVGRLLRAPVVVSEHYGGFTRGVVPASDRDAARAVFERAALVCPVSRDLEGHLRTLAPRARFVTVPNVVDDEIFRPSADERPITRDGLRLVTVGNLVPIKGHDLLLEALPPLRRVRKISLDVVGDGELREDLATLAATLGVGDDVRFVGRKSKAEVAAALRAADVFVLPSLGENMPCALLEALSCGLPAVASRVGGVPEVLGEEHGGVMVDPGSSAALASGLEMVASTLDRHDRAGTAAAAHARYGYDAIGERWSEVYATAVAGRGP